MKTITKAEEQFLLTTAASKKKEFLNRLKKLRTSLAKGNLFYKKSEDLYNQTEIAYKEWEQVVKKLGYKIISGADDSFSLQKR